MAKRRKKTLTFTEQIRTAIETCGVTRYRIAQETDVSEAALSRFMTGERGLATSSLDKLAEYLKLELRMRGRRIG
ncbi:MAG: helix-turn-helix transcriptional regulator [Planctomycetes bacterium]|nr:helix-turn-helix transcriptional regulator [Planctomycetota bacterium]